MSVCTVLGHKTIWTVLPIFVVQLYLNEAKLEKRTLLADKTIFS